MIGKAAFDLSLITVVIVTIESKIEDTLAIIVLITTALIQLARLIKTITEINLKDETRDK